MGTHRCRHLCRSADSHAVAAVAPGGKKSSKAGVRAANRIDPVVVDLHADGTDVVARDSYSAEHAP